MADSGKGPIGRMKRGYILTMDQSDVGKAYPEHSYPENSGDSSPPKRVGNFPYDPKVPPFFGI
eukprot:8872425-Pyramimonas_sp.AAC.1